MLDNKPSTFAQKAAQLEAGLLCDGEQDIPQLLEWIQDMNRPGAELAAEKIVQFGNAIVPALREALRSDDSIWHNWIFTVLGTKVESRVWRQLVNEITKIAQEIDDEGAHIAAMQVLVTHELVALDQVADWLAKSKASHRLDSADYINIDRKIQQADTK